MCLQRGCPEWEGKGKKVQRQRKQHTDKRHFKQSCQEVFFLFFFTDVNTESGAFSIVFDACLLGVSENFDTAQELAGIKTLQHHETGRFACGCRESVGKERSRLGEHGWDYNRWIPCPGLTTLLSLRVSICGGKNVKVPLHPTPRTAVCQTHRAERCTSK